MRRYDSGRYATLGDARRATVATAWHEAGHAVAALTAGARFSSASIHAGSGTEGRVHRIQGAGDLAFVVDAAGQIAEQLRAWTLLDDDRLREWLPTWRDDGGDARRFRANIRPRFGTDEFAAWRHSRGAADSAAAEDPPSSPRPPAPPKTPPPPASVRHALRAHDALTQSAARPDPAARRAPGAPISRIHFSPRPPEPRTLTAAPRPDTRSHGTARRDGRGGPPGRGVLSASRWPSRTAPTPARTAQQSCHRLFFHTADRELCPRSDTS